MKAYASATDEGRRGGSAEIQRRSLRSGFGDQFADEGDDDRNIYQQ